MSTMKDTANLLALKEEIAAAIRSNNIDEKMDVIRLKAADLNLDEADLNRIIAEQKTVVQKESTLMKRLAPKKMILSIISIALVVIEWILAFSIAGKLSFGGLLLLLLINIITILVLLIIVSIILNKRKK